MKKKIASDIYSLMREFLDKDESDYSESYIGVVEDNNDPLKHGRCRVRVHGLYDDIATKDLPWALPKLSIPFGVKGSFIVPEIGTVVEVNFDDGDIYEPCFGSKIVDTKNMNFTADKDEDYPNSMIIYETSNGDYLKVNRSKGEFILKTGAGVFLKLSQNGDIQLSNDSSENGDANIELRGNFTLDNRLGNVNLITNTCSLSAFGNVKVASNGGIEFESLDDYKIKTNRSFDVTTGDRTLLKSRTEIRTETFKNTVYANSFNINPAVPMGSISTDLSGIPDPKTLSTTFNVGIGDDKTKTMMMTVAPDPLGGPFNAIPFDTLTGLPHQGRIATGVILPAFATDSADRLAETAKQIADFTEQNTKDMNAELASITKKFASFDSQVQLIMGGALGATAIATEKAAEISATTAKYATLLTEGVESITNEYMTYLSSPIYGDILSGKENERYVYNTVTLPSAKIAAELDITGKTRDVDIAGAGAGIITEV